MIVSSIKKARGFNQDLVCINTAKKLNENLNKPSHMSYYVSFWHIEPKLVPSSRQKGRTNKITTKSYIKVECDGEFIGYYGETKRTRSN